MGGGRATATFGIKQIITLTDKLMLRPDDGIQTAISILGMVVSGTDEKDEEYKLELGAALRNVLRSLNWGELASDRGMRDHYLNQVTRFALKYGTVEDEAREILNEIVDNLLDKKRYFVPDLSKLFLNFFEFFPRVALNSTYRLDQKGSFQQSIYLLSDRYNNRKNSAVTVVPTDVLIAWCNESPDDRFLFAAATCRLIETDPNDEEKAVRISETAIQILAQAPDKQAILTEYSTRLKPSSGSSFSTIIKKRIPLLPQLNPNADPELAKILHNLKIELQQRMEFERERELAMEREENTSFE